MAASPSSASPGPQAAPGATAGPIVDWEEVQRFLSLIGRGGTAEEPERLVLALFPEAEGACLHRQAMGFGGIVQQRIEEELGRPRLVGQRLALGMVINAPGPKPADWGTKPEHFGGGRGTETQKQAERERRCREWNLPSRPPGAKGPKCWGAQNSHIGRIVGGFAEGDGFGHLEEAEAIEVQMKLPELAGLPPPTIAVWSGSRSLHLYWLLALGEVLTPEQFRRLQRALAAAIEAAVPAAKADKSIHNPSRIMRIPGGLHPKTGGRCRIHAADGPRYSASRLLELTEEIEKRTGTAPGAARSSAAPPAGPSDYGSRNPSGVGWFDRLTREEQMVAAAGMLALLPVRGEPGSGTYDTALRSLASVAHHFGPEDARTVCCMARWDSAYWDQDAKIDNLAGSSSGNDRGIGSLIRDARAAGWEHPLEKEEREREAWVMQHGRRSGSSGNGSASSRNGAGPEASASPLTPEEEAAQAQQEQREADTEAEQPEATEEAIDAAIRALVQDQALRWPLNAAGVNAALRQVAELIESSEDGEAHLEPYVARFAGDLRVPVGHCRKTIALFRKQIARRAEEARREKWEAGRERREAHYQAAARVRQAEREVAGKPAWEYEVNPTTGEPIDLAAALAVVSEQGDRIAFHGEQFWRYDPEAGFWSPASEVQMQAIALGVLRRCYLRGGPDGRESLFVFGAAFQQKSTVTTLRPLVTAGPLDREAPAPFIATLDGTVDLRTGELKPHSPAFGCITAVDARFLGLRQEPPAAFLRFVLLCYGEDALPVVRAFLRWIVDPTIRYGEAWHLLGDSHTGKGLLLDLGSSLLDPALVASLTHPADLEKPEHLSQFVIGKRLVTFGDCPTRAPRFASGHLGVWYRLVTNETVTGRRLHSNDTWTGKAHVRSVISSTAQLQLGNSRDGYLTRVLTLPTLPRLGEKDPSLKDALIGSTEAHRRLRGELLGWALAMPIEEVNAVLDRNDPHGILQEAADELAVQADHASRWADRALVPHPGGPHAPVGLQQWQEMFDNYILWCGRCNIKQEGTLETFIGQIRDVLGPKRCLKRCKGPRPERRNFPRFDAGFALRQHIAHGAFQEGGLALIAQLEQAERPDPQ